MSRAIPVLGTAAAVLLAASVSIAIVRPGGLGDRDEPGRVAAPTTTTAPLPSTTATTAPGPTTTSTLPGTDVPRDGSGLGTDGAGQVGDGNLVATGGTSLAAPGLTALGSGLVLRQRSRRRR